MGSPIDTRADVNNNVNVPVHLGGTPMGGGSSQMGGGRSQIDSHVQIVIHTFTRIDKLLSRRSTDFRETTDKYNPGVEDRVEPSISLSSVGMTR